MKQENNKTKKKYSVVLADPPWDIQQKGAHGAAKHYDLMNLDEIRKMGEAIQAITEDNAHLWLWVTNATIPYVKEILEDLSLNFDMVQTSHSARRLSEECDRTSDFCDEGQSAGRFQIAADLAILASSRSFA